MAPEHPGEVPHWFKPGMSSPPEPLIQVTLGPRGPAVIPAAAKGFLKQVGAVDFEVKLLQLREAQLLTAGQIIRVLQPDVAGLCHELLMFLAFSRISSRLT